MAKFTKDNLDIKKGDNCNYIFFICNTINLNN